MSKEIKEKNEELLFSEISEALHEGSRREVADLCKGALLAGFTADDILNRGLLPGMDRVAEEYRVNQIFVPHVIMVASAMKAGTDILTPYLSEAVGSKGKACFGTVRGDIHDIGKCLCTIMVQNRGIEVIDLGVNVSAEEFIHTAIREECDIIGCSALLTSTMTEMSEIVKLAEKAGIRDSVKIMVGGAPVSKKFADGIGADFYTNDAPECADIAAKICDERRRS